MATPASTFALTFALTFTLANGAGATEKVAPKSLGELNDLTRLLIPSTAISAAEIDNTLEIGEVVALRDAARLPSPMGITYAGSIEKILEADGKNERARRVLVELALGLSCFAGPQSAACIDPFLPALLQAQGIKPDEALPRPQLQKELAGIGEWGLAAVARWATGLPPEQATTARVRLAFERGRFAEAAGLARQALGSSGKSQPATRWQAWLAASLTLLGKEKDAAPYLAAALASGGEAERIARYAQARRARELAIDRAARLLKSLGSPTTAKLDTVRDGCQRLLDGAKGPIAPAVAETILVCASLLWDDPARTGAVERAAELAPTGSSGAPVRAAALLRMLFGQSTAQRPTTGEARDALLQRYLTEVKGLSASAEERRIFLLLGYLGAASDPLAWAPAGEEELRLLDELATKSPCDSQSFPLRALAVRRDRAALGRLLETVVRGCADAAGGAAVTQDAVGLLLQLAHEVPSTVPQASSEIDSLLLRFSRAHSEEPQAVGAHADAVALKALSAVGGGKAPNPIALEAALSRYAEAIARSTPSSGAVARQRLESNAAHLSIALGRLAGDGAPELRAKFYLRAAHHLRFALALGEVPAVTAVRAQFDLDSGSGTGATGLDLAKMPPGRGRARAACMLAEEASERGDAKETRRLVELASAKPPADERPFDLPELLVETSGVFSVILEDRALRPFVELKPFVYLAPACDPAKIALPAMPSLPDGGASSTPAPRKAAGKSPAR